MEELSPKQIDFLARYTNPSSPTFSNALQSALKAGYSQEYSESITHVMPDWLADNIGSSKRLRKAEKNLDEVQELSIFDDEGKVKTDILKERTKVDMFMAETVGKIIYSKRTETDLTSKGERISLSFDSAFNDTTPKTENNS